MQMKCRKKLLSHILCTVLIVAMALFTTGCNGKNKDEVETTSKKETKVEAEQQMKVLGEGSTKFDFTVVDKEGSKTEFEVHTDKKTVGEALVELKLIEGEDSEYGLFVKKVNGIAADYDKDGMYWAFYINGEYAMSGVDSTEIKEGQSYSFKMEKS